MPGALPPSRREGIKLIPALAGSGRTRTAAPAAAAAASAPSRRSWVLRACCTRRPLPWRPRPAPRTQGSARPPCALHRLPWARAEPHEGGGTRFPTAWPWACTRRDHRSLLWFPGSTGCLGVRVCGFVKYGPYKSLRV